MAVFRIEKTRDYTVMSNHHLKDRTLTLKSKGLLSMMLSLPDEWNYTTRGLAAICREGVDSIGAALKELEAHGYIRRTQLRDEKGKITDTEYVIYEMPQCEPPSSPGTPLPGTAKPYTENPDMGVPDTAEPCTENPAQLNTNQTKTDLSSTEISNPIPSNPPTPAGVRMGTDRMGARECYREVILDNIEYSYLVQDSHIDREQLDEIVDLIVDTVCSARKVIRIAGDDYPAEVVKSRFMKLDSSHVQYVMDCMKDNTTYVRNIKKYLLAALYNAPTTINSYYSSLVQQWHITENVHEPIISRSDFETVQRILENAPVKRPNGDGEIHPLSGLLFCKDCGAKMHIRIDYRNGGKRHVAYCSEYHKGKAKNPKCHSPHIMDADLLMQTVAEVLKKIEDYSISNRAEFEALVKKNLAMQQTDQTKKQQKRIPQITTRLEQIDKVLNKLYEDNALGTIPQDRYEQMSQKYSEEYYALKAELATLQEQLSAYENAGGRAQRFLKLTERHAAFTDLTPAILNEFISRIEVHERDQKRARYAIQHISIYFNYIGKFENEVTQLAEPTEQEIRQMREEIEEAKKEKSRAYHRQYSREYRARNLEKQREYDRMKAREYRARRKAQAAAAQPAQ